MLTADKFQNYETKLGLYYWTSNTLRSRRYFVTDLR